MTSNDVYLENRQVLLAEISIFINPISQQVSVLVHITNMS